MKLYDPAKKVAVAFGFDSKKLDKRKSELSFE